MRRRGQTTSMQERIEISERSQAGQSDADIATRTTGLFDLCRWANGDVVFKKKVESA